MERIEQSVGRTVGSASLRVEFVKSFRGKTRRCNKGWVVAE